MKFYKRALNILILLFVILYPIMPSYGYINSDLILYILFLLQTLGILILKEERLETIKNIKLLVKDKIFISLTLLNIIMFLSTLVADNKRIAFTSSLRFSMYIFIYYSISYKLNGRNIFKILLNSYISIAVLSSLFSILQLIKYKFYNISLDGEHRISSFLENPNNLGAYTILSIFLVLILIINSKKKSEKVVFSICSILLFFNIVLSQSRNALLALLFGCILISIVYEKRFLIASIALPIVLLIIPQSRVRFLDILDLHQNSSRFKIWKTAGLIIKDNPLLGVGNNNFANEYPIYIYHNPDLMIHGSYKALHPHNIILKMQSELGILGSIFFTMFIIFTILSLINHINKCKDNRIKSILIAITISFISFQFMNLIDCYYDSLKVIITMFVLLSFQNHCSNINKY